MFHMQAAGARGGAHGVSSKSAVVTKLWTMILQSNAKVGTHVQAGVSVCCAHTVPLFAPLNSAGMWGLPGRAG